MADLVKLWGAAAATPAGAMLIFFAAFYLLAAFLVTRQLLMGSVIDRAMAAITLKKPPVAETARDRFIAVQTVGIFAAAFALLLLSPLAPWAFAAMLAFQALYLFWLAPRFLDPGDEPDERGRRQTRNAAIVYGVATLVVVLAWRAGALPHAGDVEWLRSALVAAAALAFAGWLAWRIAMPFGRKGREDDEQALDDDDFGASSSADPLPGTPSEITVRAELHCSPLWARVDGDLFNPLPEVLGLSERLGAVLISWQDRYDNAWDMDDPAKGPDWSDAEFASHDETGRKLAVRVAGEIAGRHGGDVRVLYEFSSGEVIDVTVD